MHNNNSIVPYISPCSGYEGIGLGLHRCIPNLRCIGYCEREAFAISNLVAKMENGLLDAAPVFTDVTTFPWRDYATFMAEGILSFGWPCQPVSTAGKRKATEDERWLFDIIADGISILRPGMLFAENVEGLLSARMPDGSSVFGHCIERLESLHYKVAAGIFSASEVGAVHQRKRVFIMAHRKDERFQFWKTQRWGVTNRSERTEIWDQSIGQGGVSGEELAHSSNEGLQGREWFWKAGTQGSSSGHSTECGSYSWPSRPGEQQYAWEPPRVVGNAKYSGLTTEQVIRSDEETSNEWRKEEQEQARQLEGTDRSFNVPSIRGCQEGSELGNAECIRIPTSREHGAMDETSGIPADREGSESPQADTESSSTREREGSWSNASKCSEIEPKMGRDIDGATYGVDISELSGLCHSELAEIREWMVKGDNRTDELRSCGNGVVPATAERAFRVLMEELINK
jgi:site-specific DNA-cytosine methylase